MQHKKIKQIFFEIKIKNQNNKMKTKINHLYLFDWIRIF